MDFLVTGERLRGEYVHHRRLKVDGDLMIAAQMQSLCRIPESALS